MDSNGTIVEVEEQVANRFTPRPGQRGSASRPSPWM